MLNLVVLREREAWNWSVSTWNCCKNSLKMKQFYLVQCEESYYCLPCCTGCWENTWIQGRISFHKGWYLPLWKAVSGSLPSPGEVTWWSGDGQSLGMSLFLTTVGAFLLPNDPGDVPSRWWSICFVERVAWSFCGGSSEPLWWASRLSQILAASRTVSCEVRMLSLSKPCEMLVKLF